MLSIARSRLALASQFLFLAVNAFALVLGLVYNHKTPELYENNVHSKIGWIITWVASAWVGMALIEAYASRTKDTLSDRHAGNVLNAANIAQYQRVHNFQASSQSRWSNDSGQGTERNSASLYGGSRSPSVEAEQEGFLDAARRYSHNDDEDSYDDSEKQGFLKGTVVDRFLLRNVARFAAGKPLRILRFLYVVIERTILIQGLTALSSGTIVYGGIGVSAAYILSHSQELTSASSTEEPSSTSSHTTSKAASFSDTVCSHWVDGWERSRILDGRGTSNRPWRWWAVGRRLYLRPNSPNPLSSSSMAAPTSSWNTWLLGAMRGLRRTWSMFRSRSCFLVVVW